jgi:cobalt-zinc-cadmium resistance protein CzcA
MLQAQHERRNQLANIMLEKIIDFSLRRRWLVALAVLAMSAGRLQLFPSAHRCRTRHHQLQVQINTSHRLFAAGDGNASPTRRKRDVGLPAVVPRSLSRYGLSQVTVIFEDGTDIYFARQLVSQRLQSSELRIAADWPELGPIATGLGEILMFGQPEPGARKADGSARRTDLHTAMDWIVAPQLARVPGSPKSTTSVVMNGSTW